MENRSSKKTQLTAAQAEVLEFIKDQCDTDSLPPTYREIQAYFGYKAVGTVQDHVKALIEKGHLEKPKRGKKQGPSRGIMPKGHRRDGVHQIPIYGEIAAGSARDSDQIKLGQITVSQGEFENPSFALRVVGDSMIEVGILEGDLLLVERGKSVKSGDIVVALLDGETTVKRYLKKGAQLFLAPENHRLKPIEIKDQALDIQGRVIGLQRKI